MGSELTTASQGLDFVPELQNPQVVGRRRQLIPESSTLKMASAGALLLPLTCRRSVVNCEIKSRCLACVCQYWFEGSR